MHKVEHIFFCLSAYVLSHFSHVQLFVTLWTVSRQAPLTMGLSRQEYWSGLPCPPPGDLLDPGIQPESPGEGRQALHHWATSEVIYCCCSVAQSCLTLCDPMDCSTPGLLAPHHLPTFDHVHVHFIREAMCVNIPWIAGSYGVALNIGAICLIFF